MCISKYIRRFPWKLAGISAIGMSAISLVYINTSQNKLSNNGDEGVTTDVPSVEEVSRLAEEIFFTVFEHRLDKINDLYDVDSIVLKLKELEQKPRPVSQNEQTLQHFSLSPVWADETGSLTTSNDQPDSKQCDAAHQISSVDNSDECTKRTYWRCLIQSCLARLAILISTVVDDLLLCQCLSARQICKETAIRWVLRMELPRHVEWKADEQDMVSMESSVTLPELARLLRSKVNSADLVIESPAAIVNQVLNTDDCQMLRFTFKDRLVSLALCQAAFQDCRTAQPIASLVPGLQNSYNQLIRDLRVNISEILVDPIFQKFQTNVIRILAC